MEKRVKSVGYMNSSIVLKDVLLRCSERGYIVMDTNRREYNVWIFDISIDHKDFFFANQKKTLDLLYSSKCNTIRLYDDIRIDDCTRCMITDRVDRDSLGSIVSMESMIDYDIINIGISIGEIMRVLHDSHMVSNIINPEHIYRYNGTYTCIDYTLSYDRECVELSTHQDVLTSSVFHTTNKRHAYTNNVHIEDDIKNYGLLLYQMCYGNLQISYDDHDCIVFPTHPHRSYIILNIIQHCVHTDRCMRYDIHKILSDLYNEKTIDIPNETYMSQSAAMANINIHDVYMKDKNSNDNNGKKKGEQKSSWGLMISRATTDTEGWFKSYVEPSLSTPDDGYVVKILEKAWKKREKVMKLMGIIDKYVLDKHNVYNCISMIKLLMFLHKIITRGPSEVLTTPAQLKSRSDKDGSINVSYISHILTTVREVWCDISNNYSSYKGRLDGTCTHAISYFIYFYSIVLCNKSSFGCTYIRILSGNLSVEPMSRSLEVYRIFSLQIYRDMYTYCSNILLFLNASCKDFDMRILQIPIVRMCIDECTSVVAPLLHYTVFYKIVSYSLDIDDSAYIDNILDDIYQYVDTIIMRLIYTVDSVKQSPVFAIIQDTLPHVDMSAIEYVKHTDRHTRPIDIRSFDVLEYIPLDGCIGSFTIQRSYGCDAYRSDVSLDEIVLQIKREIVKDINRMGRSEASTNNKSPASAKINSMMKHKRPIFKLKSKIVASELVDDKDGRNDQPADIDDIKVYDNSKHNKFKRVSSFNEDRIPYMSLDDDEVYDNNIDDNDHIKIKSSLSFKSQPLSHPSKKRDGIMNEDEGDNHMYILGGNPKLDFFDSAKNHQVTDPLLDNDDNDRDNKRYERSREDFIKLQPINNIEMVDRSIQCDMYNDVHTPSHDITSFDLLKYIRDEITKGSVYHI